MKKLMIIFISLLTLMFGASSNLLAYDDLCWTINGWPLEVAANDVGYVGSDLLLTVSGSGTSTGAPVAGAIVYPASGDIRFSFETLATGSQHAVVHQLTLDKNTLNGSGSWRWFDSTNAGGSTATFVPCSSLTSSTQSIEADIVSQGLE
jgi:hypothetical protein